jgi:hypothetical protein
VWNCNGELAPYDVDDDVFFLVMAAFYVADAEGLTVCAGLQRGL